VIVLPVNRYPPKFIQPSFVVHVTENTTEVTTLLILTATDQDSGAFGVIAQYTLVPVQLSDLFGLEVSNQTAVLKMLKPLNRAVQAEYLLQVSQELFLC
jgi:hypothetical protein